MLDFIGAQRKEFRFASRFRALSEKPTAKLDNEIESGFPHLPSGCVIKLERVAQQRVLDNVRESIRLVRPRMLSSLRDLKQYLGRVPTLEDALDYFDTTLDQLLKRGLWSRLLADAGLVEVAEAQDEKQLAKGLRRLSHINCPLQIQAAIKHPELDVPPESGIAEMLHVSLWGAQHAEMSLAEADKRLQDNSVVVDDLPVSPSHVWKFEVKRVKFENSGRDSRVVKS